MELFSCNKRRVIVPRHEIAAFNRQWPCSTLRDRAYWFEFDASGDLVDTDCPEHDDGPAASALADDCREFLESGDHTRAGNAHCRSFPTWPDGVTESDKARGFGKIAETVPAFEIGD